MDCLTYIFMEENVIRQSLIQFYPESGIQNNKCNTVNICEHGTKSTSVITDQVLYCSSALCIFKSMINNPEFCQFILQVQSGVIYFYNLYNNF